VFGLAGRRVAEAVVALFALLGFVFVPLGQKTAFEHAIAVFSTPAAKLAFQELTHAVSGLRDKFFQALAPAPPAAPKQQPTPDVPKLPRPR
jgi:hypothetical protein